MTLSTQKSYLSSTYLVPKHWQNHSTYLVPEQSTQTKCGTPKCGTPRHSHPLPIQHSHKGSAMVTCGPMSFGSPWSFHGQPPVGCFWPWKHTPKSSKNLAARKTCPNTKLLFMEEILNNHRLDVIDNLVDNGISYQPQLGSRISEPSTVPLWTCFLLTQVDQVASPSSIICSQTKLYDVCRITLNGIRFLVVDMFPFHGLLT